MSNVAEMHTTPEKCSIYAKFCNEHDPWLYIMYDTLRGKLQLAHFQNWPAQAEI